MNKRIVIGLLLSTCVCLNVHAADTKISALPAGTTLAGTEAIPAVQSGATVKITPAQIKTYVGAPAAAGSSKQIQYNDTGALAAGPSFTWDESVKTMTVGGSGSIVSPSGTFSPGLPLTIKTGDGSGAGNNGGTLALAAGAGGGSNGGAGGININGGPSSSTGAGGIINITGGYSLGSGAGGSVNVAAGSSGAGNGGSITLTATDGTGGNSPGGNVVITLGANTGSGAPGAIQIVGGTTTGAQTATFVATNKPGTATGAPTLWLRVVVTGVTYWMPLFAD